MKRSKRPSVGCYFWGSTRSMCTDRLWLSEMSINALARVMHRSTLVRLVHSHVRTAWPDREIQPTENVSTLRGRGNGKCCPRTSLCNACLFSNTLRSCLSRRHAHRSQRWTSTRDRRPLWDEFTTSHSLPGWLTMEARTTVLPSDKEFRLNDSTACSAYKSSNHVSDAPRTPLIGRVRHNSRQSVPVQCSYI